MIKTKEEYKQEWTVVDAHLLFAEMLYNADIKYMHEFFGFQYRKHLFLIRNGTMTFYKNISTERAAIEYGAKKYSDTIFIKHLITKSLSIEQELEKVLARINIDLTKLSNHELWQLFLSFFTQFSQLYACYRFTRKDFYVKVIEEMKKHLPEPRDDLIEALLAEKTQDINIPEETKSLAHYLALVGKRRWGMHEFWMKALAGAEKLFEAIGERMSLTKQEVTYSSSREIESYLIQGVKPDKDMITNRMAYVELEYKGSGFNLNAAPTLALAQLETKNEVKGMCAHPGRIKGTVKIINEALLGVSAKELSKVKKGDIIVTNMTSPDMVSVLGKAGAFVTDEGGILCHAAVVAREMQKPCVVGTKIATKVFKDGDIVEVDASSGIIRKIK